MANLEPGSKILLDTSFFIAFFYEKDPHHQQAQDLNEHFSVVKPRFVTNNYIVAETLTVMLLKLKSPLRADVFGQSAFQIAKRWFEVYQVIKPLQCESYKIFKEQNKFQGGFWSFVDCTLIAQAKKLDIKTLFTFDSGFQQLVNKGFTINA